MTVAELIEALKAYPPELPVLIEDRPIIVYGQLMNEPEWNPPKLVSGEAWEDDEEPVPVPVLMLKSIKDK